MAVYDYKYLKEDYKKPIEFDLSKGLDKDQIDKINYYLLNPNDSGRMSLTDLDMNKTYGTTTLGTDLTDVEMQTHIEAYDRERINFIRGSEDIVKDYNNLIELDIDKIIYDKDTVFYSCSIELIAKHIAETSKMIGMTEKEIRDYLKGVFFCDVKEATKLQMLLLLRDEYCDAICRKLSAMIKKNYGIIGYTRKEYEDLYKELKSGKNISPDSMNNLRIKLINNTDQFLTYNNTCLDMTKLGLKAKIFLPIKTNQNKDENIEVFNYSTAINNGIYIKSTKATAIDAFLQKSAIYDCIILCHGGENAFNISNIMSEDALRLSPYTHNFYNLCKKKGKDVNYILKALGNNKENIWLTTAPVSINGGVQQRSVNLLVADAIAAGYKKILLCNCNPGRHQLDKVLLTQSGVRIVYSTLDNLTEEYESDDEIMDLICESEEYLTSICEEYKFDYYGVLNERNIYEIVDETSNGLSYIVRLGKRILGIIISIFKQLVNMVKRLYIELKTVFKNIKDKYQKLPKPLEVPMIVLKNGVATVNNFKIHNISELEKYANTNIKTIQVEIDKREREQVELVKKIEKYIEDLYSSNTLVENLVIKNGNYQCDCEIVPNLY